MPSSYDSSTSSVEIIGVTSRRSSGALATDCSATVAGADAAPTLSGPVAEGYGYASSLLRQREVDALCRHHGVPKAYTARPADGRRACTPPPEGAVCVYADALEAGMRLPLHGFVSETLTHFGLAPSQLMPNGWRILLRFVVLCHDAGVPPSLAVFWHFFSLSTYAKSKGWYYFRGKDAAARALFTGLPRSNKGWHHRFFFLMSPEPWPCPVRWGEPPSNSSMTDPVLTNELKKSVAKLRDALSTAVDLGIYPSGTNLAAAFSSSLARESPPRAASSRPTSAAAEGLGTDQSKKKAVKEKVKTESAGRDMSAVSSRKRNREEANSNDGPCHFEVSSLRTDHGCSASCLCVPPGFDPKPRYSPVPAARKVPSTFESMLQTVNYASSYALELEKKLAEHVATKAELEKQLMARDEEVAALRGQLKQGKAGLENDEAAAAVQQVVDFLVCDGQVRSRAEHALERYTRWKVHGFANRGLQPRNVSDFKIIS